MQARIDEIQQLYREWTQLLPRLQSASKDWQRAAELMQALGGFYFSGEFLAFHDALTEGATVDLTTPGEYSVMSEDTLWDAFQTQQALARELLPILHRTLASGDDAAPAAPDTLA